MSRAARFEADELAAAGVAVVQRDGWGAISVRAVAAELGVTPMAVYRVASDADALRHLIADRAGLPLRRSDPRLVPDTEDTEGADLFGGLRDWAGALYAHLGRHPGLASYVLLEWTELPTWLRMVDDHLGSALRFGLADDDAVGTVNAVFAYVLVRAQLRDAARHAPRRRLAPLRGAPVRYPHVRRLRAQFATRQTETHFAFGLQALLVGLAANGPSN